MPRACARRGRRGGWAEKGRLLTAPPIEIDPRYWFNPELTSRFFLVPGVDGDRAHHHRNLADRAGDRPRMGSVGRWEALMATPLSMVEFIATKVIPYFLLGLASAPHLHASGGHRLRRAIPRLTVRVAADRFCVPGSGAGPGPVHLGGHQESVRCQPDRAAYGLPARAAAPRAFFTKSARCRAGSRFLTYAVPVRYLMPLLQSVFLAGDIWKLFLPNILAMLGFGLVFFFATSRVTRRRIA